MIYFCHGVPGGPEDASLLGIEGVAAPDLFAARPLAQFDAATADAADGSVHLVGFSIGAMVALRLAASRPERIGKVTLIAPAAPLSLGDFLPDMAGKPVFLLAKRLPSLLRFVTGLQGLVVKIAPDFVLDRLFAKADPHERRLVSEPEVRRVLRAGLRNSMVNHPTAYVQAISAYVGNWSGALQMVTCPVEIWHGEADSWAPVAMSEALVQNLPKGAQLHHIAGAGHYGALKAARITPIT
jgi:pimeloyl-ACP methyl ester carboxylesterase